MGDWYTQYTTPQDQLGQDEGTTCQRTRFILNEDETFGMYRDGLNSWLGLGRVIPE